MTKPTIRTLIVDDELLARRRISNLLRDKSEFTIVGECANGKSAVTAIQQQAPDLVFLDVQMPDLDGFGVLNALEQPLLPVIVFVTAYDQYAIKAFEFHALDYLLKPFDDERFEKTIEWAKEQLRQKEVHQLGERMIALLQDIWNRNLILSNSCVFIGPQSSTSNKSKSFSQSHTENMLWC
jgi:two-component system LytT family response regulator